MRRILLAVSALAWAGAVQAETLRVQAWAPAGSDQAAAVRSVQVEPFGGDAGDELTIQVEDALRAVDLGDGPWLRVIPAATGSGGEALLRGVATTQQRLTNYTEERERCIRDDKGNCTAAKEKITVKCVRRQVDLEVQLRLIARDGTLLWSDNRPETYTDSRCELDEAAPRGRSAITRELAGKVAVRVRGDFAPRRWSEDVRVDEGRKGLSKPDGESFKRAVRSVKDGKAPEACMAWAALAQANPGHAPTLYNIGLCAESAGDPVRAGQVYRQVLALNPKHGLAKRGLERIAAQDRALRQIAAHGAD